MPRVTLVAFLGALLGVACALLAYDTFVVQPRARAAETRLGLDLAEARHEARQITADMQASVDRSVAGVRQAMDEEARELETRALLADAVARASIFKTAIAEHRATNGDWPHDHGSAGLPSPDATAGGPVRAIRLGVAGLVDIELGAPFPPGSGIALTPIVREETQSIEWQCRMRGDPRLARHLPGCR